MVDKYYLSGGTYVLPPGGKDEIIRYGEDKFIEFRKKNPEATWQDFMTNSGYKFIKFTYKKATPPPKIVTPEGDTLVFAKAIYKVNDYERTIEALKGIPGFEILDSSPEEIHIGWLVEKGDITMNNNQLTLNCLSMERLEHGKNLLKVLGNAIELQSESKEYPDLKERS